MRNGARYKVREEAKFVGFWFLVQKNWEKNISDCRIVYLGKFLAFIQSIPFPTSNLSGQKDVLFSEALRPFFFYEDDQIYQEKAIFSWSDIFYRFLFTNR